MKAHEANSKKGVVGNIGRKIPRVPKKTQMIPKAFNKNFFIYYSKYGSSSGLIKDLGS